MITRSYDVDWILSKGRLPAKTRKRQGGQSLSSIYTKGSTPASRRDLAQAPKVWANDPPKDMHW